MAECLKDALVAVDNNISKGSFVNQQALKADKWKDHSQYDAVKKSYRAMATEAWATATQQRADEADAA